MDMEKTTVQAADTQQLTLVHYDTIYRTVVLRSASENGTFRDFYAENHPSKTTPGLSELQDTDTRLAVPAIDNTSTAEQKSNASDTSARNIHFLSATGEQPETTEESRQRKIVQLNTGAVLLCLPERERQGPVFNRDYRLPDLGLIMLPPPAERRRDKLIRRFRPHSTAVGLLGGTAFTLEQGVTNDKGNFSIGLTGETAFGRHVRLFAAGSYLSTRLRANNALLGDLNIPTLAPPTPNHLLDYVQLRQAIWDFSLGFRYVAAPEKRLSPVVSAAWLLEYAEDQSLVYTFINQLNGDETYVRAPHAESLFRADGLELGLGLQLAVNTRLSFRFRSFYQRQFGGHDSLLARRWGLSGGILYRI
jgi:hypothetical protein